jgi:serine/threonine-protein kinase
MAEAALSPERWAVLEPLLEAALDLPSTERAAYLDQACAHDAPLRAEVEALLRAHDAHPDFLETPFDLGVLPDLNIGQPVGPYRLVRLLGEGGMGAVYLAERDDLEFHHPVAVKLVQRGRATPALVRRFREERRILASLDHPHIARFLDAGATAEGLPYLVMEYVEGTPLTRYCDDHALALPERLRLFMTVCEAVAYAHQNLVVHRDLKPSNILVTRDGTVKLLDFGIAKLLDAPAEAQTLTLERLLTPDYAAPEQVRGAAITTATDVYALGVLLYELLSGHRPYRLMGQTPDEMTRLVCEQVPTRPSSIVGRTEAVVTDTGTVEITPEAVSRVRALSPDRLRRWLRGDLDNIVMKALRKEPERRYAAAAQLRDDLHRYERRLPVAARPDTLGYRAARFIQRHRLGVAGAVLAAGSLVAGLLVALAGQQRAEREAARAEQVSSFLIELFEASDPHEANDGTATARQMLDAGLAKARGGLAEQPAAYAPLLAVIGRVYNNLALYDSGQVALREAIRAYRQQGGPPAELADALRDRADLEYRLGQLDSADVLLQEALRRCEQAGNDPMQRASILNSHAVVLSEQNQLDRAITMLREVVALRRQALGNQPDGNLAANLHNLSMLLEDNGQLQEAAPLIEEALRMAETLYGPAHPYVAFSLNSIAGLHGKQGRYAEAEAELQRALTIGEKALGPAHPFTSTVQHNLAELWFTQQRYDQALPQYRKALDLRRRSLPPDHPDVATSLAGLGRALLALDQPAEATTMLQESLALQEAAFGPDHPETARTRSALEQARAALQ